MEVELSADGEQPGEVVPVSLETVVTETGMLQLWCVARDGRRWKLEFNVQGARGGAHERSASTSAPPTRRWPISTPAKPRTRDFPPVHILPIPQLVAPGRVEAAAHAAVVPVPGRTAQPVGAYAREQGALVPTRLVHSAKSWLSNPDVDRTAKILPWDSQETGRVLSPVEVSARFLAQVARGVGQRERGAAGRAGHRAHRAGVVRRRSARADRAGGARGRASRS